MQLGAVFPQFEIGTDPVVIRDYAQTAEGLGFRHLMVIEHVLGANVHRPDRQSLPGTDRQSLPGTGRQGRRWPHDSDEEFHEPFVLLGFLAAVTQEIELATGVIVLPQRQTALVAKQAAAADVLSRGRLRLGVGVGWNDVEFEALGMDFGNRGQRIVEQIRVLRLLWTKPLVTFEGRYHKITDAGINPLPVQRPIPIWMGGNAEPVLRRVARITDGWSLSGEPQPGTEVQWGRIKEYAREAGRDPSTIGLQGALRYGDGDPQRWRRVLERWQQIGATHVYLNTVRSGLTAPRDHIAALHRAKRELGF